MTEDFSHLTGNERIKAENEFLKMKLMLEHGAKFGGNENNELPELPAEIENEFLNNMVAFEKQFEEQKMIRVFDKIGKPRQFKPVKEIPDSDIDKAWIELRDYMNENGIDLDVCSPNISVRELYRFTTEELFEHETDDMDLPGWTTHFIYDEFHPDPVYDNTRTATHDCINYILEKEPLEWMHNFRNEGLRLNEHYPLSIEELKTIVNRFKTAYDNLEINEIAPNNCVVNDKLSSVTGTYSMTATAGTGSFVLSGNWKVVLELNEEFGYWYITEITIEGIRF
jgi:hypothetical protein